MTSWTPEIAQQRGPRYLRIADSLASAVSNGNLKPGDRLPTHRDLAWKLGVTVGTITRAYAEAERRGLISGEVGRGTFIRERAIDVPPAPPPVAVIGEFIDLARNFPSIDRTHRAIGEVVADVGRTADMPSLMGYATILGLKPHREAAVQWLARNRLPAEPGQIAISNGCQHAMQLALLALARPGDVILTEQLTFYGLKALASLLSFKLHGVELDEYGLVPSALETACKQTGAKVLYCIPTLHNPTTALMPAARREEIAAICKRHGVTIIEDDIYGFLDETAPPPLTTFAPDHAIYVTSLSKCVAPGLRIGFLKASVSMIERISTNLRGTTWMATPLMAEVATRLIRSGQAERMATWQRTEAVARQEIAADILDDSDIMTNPSSFHLWLRLPEPWRREDFTAVARRRGVGVAPADAFTVGRAPVPHAVRVGLSAANDRAELERALRILAEITAGPPEQGFPIV